MKIQSIRIENFKAIRLLEAENLSNSIVIAGPNGCGKSSIFDAIRLLKSTYGQYFQSEQSLWFSEFQINPNGELDASNLKDIFFDTSKDINIIIIFQLTDQERNYLLHNASSIYQKMIRASEQYSAVIGIPAGTSYSSSESEKKEAKFIAELKEELKNDLHYTSIKFFLNGKYQFTQSEVVKSIFSVYEPNELGVIDYYGANRNYSRANVNMFQLQGHMNFEQQSQHALYNTHNKYEGIKQELGRFYINQLVAKDIAFRLGEDFKYESSLEEALKELFDIFLPGKNLLAHDRLQTAD